VSFEALAVRLTGEDCVLALFGGEKRFAIFTLDMRSLRVYLTNELINQEV